MLKEFIAEQQSLPQTKDLSIEDFLRLTTMAFDTGVDFLRDANKFRNRQINDLVTLLWRLVGNKVTPIVLDQWGVPSLSFLAIENGAKGMTPLIIIPTNYLDQVRQDPINQLGGITFMASQCRDFISGVLNKHNSDSVNKRSMGYEAETLLTVQTMAKAEKVPFVWSAYQKTVLADYPLGLKSLPHGMIYPTMPYPSQISNN